VASQWANIMNFLLYLGISLPILALGVYLFMLTTPYKENELIAGGAELGDRQKILAAQATAWDIGGKILGQAVVLASAIFHSVGPVDLVIWGLIGAVFQVIVFYLFELITPFTVIKEIPRGNVAVGIFSAFVSVASGLLLAALISY
jgi:putative membrane protein